MSVAGTFGPIEMPLDNLLITERERVEWKRSANDSDGVYHAVCAMANDLGNTGTDGHVLLGVSPDGTVAGIGQVDTHDAIQQRVTNWLRSTKISPTPSFDIRIHERAGSHVLTINVEPYPVPPIVTVGGRAWVRQGTTTRIATDADLTRLRERRPERNQPFDIRPIETATIDDLNTALLTQMFDAALLGREEPESLPNLTQWLTQQQLGRAVQGIWRPNAAAVLLYGLSPQNFVPGAKIEFARYGGVDVDATVAARKTIVGPLPDQLDAIWAQLSDHLASTPRNEEGIRSDYSPDFPLDALKELARNLVQHRLYEGTNAPGRVEWFTDRIEFSNPGAPFGRASEGDFGSNSDYRNPIITQGLVELGYVEQLGRGIRRVKLNLAQNENPPLEVQTDGFTRLIVRARIS